MAEAPVVIHSKKYWAEPINNLKASEAPGRSKRVIAASHIDNLAGMGKAIVLCQEKCLRKFNVAGAGYELYLELDGYHSHRGFCDGCRSFSDRCNTFLKSSRIK